MPVVRQVCENYRFNGDSESAIYKLLGLIKIKTKRQLFEFLNFVPIYCTQHCEAIFDNIPEFLAQVDLDIDPEDCMAFQAVYTRNPMWALFRL